MPDIGNPGKPTDNDEMQSNVFGLLRAYLAQRGYTQEWVTEAIGDIPDGRSKIEIVEDLKGAL